MDPEDGTERTRAQFMAKYAEHGYYRWRHAGRELSMGWLFEQGPSEEVDVAVLAFAEQIWADATPEMQRLRVSEDFKTIGMGASARQVVDDENI